MMTGYLSSKVAVKDSFDDDDASDDVEDEVFIRDGRNGFKVDEESGVKRPLMAPRRKCKNNIFLPETTKRPFCKRFCIPYCYGLIAIALIIGFVMGATLFLNFIPSPLYNLRLWPLGSNKAELNIIPCTDFISNDIWYKTFPGLKSEAALVSVDVNLDGVEDIIVGYSTDQGNSCSMFASAQDVCGGGALALDGKNGETIWQYWTASEVLFVDCAADITGDKIKDCLLSGKGGVLKVVDGKSGNILWGVNSLPRTDTLDLYAAQFIPDLTSDGFPDVLIAHSISQSGVLAILDGKTGKRLGHLDVPDKEGMYTVPRIMVANDGSEVVLFATGSSETSGTLYATLLTTIAINGPKDVSSVWKSDMGVTSGIIMADMNQDGSEDVILTSGDTLTVLDGNNFKLLWNVSSSSFNKDQNQILIGPTPAYFDDDLIPDLLISHMFGPSFPTIYYSQIWVANGKDGVELLEEPILGGSEVTAPGVAISYSGIGNDMFLYWRTTCNSKSQRKPFYFSKQSDIHDNARADLCRLRFNKSLDIQMYALNQHIEPPGVLIYSSKLKWNIEHNVTEHKVNKKVLPKHKVPENRRVNKLEKMRKNQELEKIYQEMPKNYPIYDTGDPNILNMLPKFQDSDDPRDPMSMQPLPGNMGEINDYDPAYPQEIDSDDSILPVINSRFRNVYEGRDEREDKLKNKGETSIRKKRKIQDEKESLPRALSTASLAKPISGDGIDVFFSTHWVTPASNVRILTERDERCIRKKVSKEQTNNLNDMDQIEIMAENECLGSSESADEDKYEDTTPIELQMTIYRVNLNCKCSSINPKTEECSKALPMEQQSYSHRATNVYYKPRIHPNLSKA